MWPQFLRELSPLFYALLAFAVLLCGAGPIIRLLSVMDRLERQAEWRAQGAQLRRARARRTYAAMVKRETGVDLDEDEVA
ncbi:MAG TPA: hypothetical protein VK681_39060 [Reyranella sp.]|nr:hypothetical protein [Reyranella sp.]